MLFIHIIKYYRKKIEKNIYHLFLARLYQFISACLHLRNRVFPAQSGGYVSGFHFFRVSLLLLSDLFIELRLILVPHNKEHHCRENRYNQEHNHACRCRPVVHIASAECLLVDKQAGCQCRIVRFAVLEQSRDIEHIQTTDQTRNKRKQKNGLNVGHRNIEESLYAVRAVHLRRLKYFRADSQNARDQCNHGGSVPHPCLDKDHNASRHSFTSQ